MKKWKATILSFLTVTAAATLTVAGLCAQKSSISAHADTLQGEQLLAPSSYEEYLSLSAPSDVAATDGYIAIADGNTLYVFDKDRNLWQEYAHTSPITKLDFGSRDTLYFLDGETNKLYSLNAKTIAPAVETGIFCSTFSIQGDNIYYINLSAGMTSIYHAPLSDLTKKKELYAGRMYSPSLSYFNGELYYVYGTDFLYKLNADNSPAKVADLPLGVISITITEGVVCCITEEGSFYAYTLADLSEKSASECEPLAYKTDGYSAVSDNGNDVYLVANNRIEKFSLTEQSFTDYSIGATSSAPNRFDGASEIVLSGNTLFIADDNNDRISVYDVHEKTFLPSIPCQLDNPVMAAYGDSLLVSTTSQAILYSLHEKSYGETLYALASDRISGNIVGSAAIYGNYYLVTDTNYCYTLTNSGEGYRHTETLRNAHYAEKLTADFSGNLYLLSNGAVYRYTEESFLAPKEEGVKICEEIPSDVIELSVDYRGNLYALSQNTLYVYTSQAEGLYALQSTKTFDAPLVYGGKNEALSFTFSIEENEVYFLYKDNYLTVTDELSLPTLKNISTEQIAQSVLSSANAEFAVVEISAGSFLVEVDANQLQGETFAYLSSYRNEQPITALKIGETSLYALLCYRENTASAYKTILVEKSRQTELDGDYKITEGYPQTGYLTNLTKAYKFPCMGLLAFGQMEKNTQVTLLYEVQGLDCEYYAVAYGEQTVFVPKANLVFFDGTPPPTETIAVGSIENNKDLMWRFAYLALGSAAICILIDTLVLRKKNKND